MKLTKFFKRMAFASLAVAVAVTAIPYSSSVKAESDAYPEEVYFPIQVLDFRRDDMLFEWNNSWSDIALYGDYFGAGEGKGLVEDELGEDGLPVYKKEIVERIARNVRNGLQYSESWGSLGTGSVLNLKVASTGEYHTLSLRKYIRANFSILTKSTNEAGLTEEDIWLPESSDSGVTYTITTLDPTVPQTYGGVTYDKVYAAVYASTDPATPVYLFRDTGITFLQDITVSKTFIGLPNSYNYKVNTLVSSGGISAEVSGEGLGPILMSSGIAFTTPASGEITVKLTATAAQTIGNITLKPNSSTYPVGDYDLSKAKYDNNPNLGWTDITTCMDYAYFVTKNFFKLNPSLNKQFTDYENLIFHKVDEDGKIYYEFAADNKHTDWSKYQLIYNPVNKTIRNRYNVAQNTAIGETKTSNAGSMFILDQAASDFKQYPIADENINGHNFHFTISSHSQFVYKARRSQTFSFTGDDDVYCFLNGHLVLDLGGAHTPTTYTINLDSIAAAHDGWLTDGEVVDLKFFYMERHSTESNFYAKLNFKLATDSVDFDMEYDSIPYGFLVDLNYNFQTLRELNTNSNITFTDNLGNVIGADDFKLGDGVSLKNDKLVVTVLDADGNVDSERSRTFEFADSSSPTAAEIAAVKEYFRNLEVTLKEVVKITGPQYDTSSKAYSDYDDVAGEVNTKGFEFKTEVDYDAQMKGSTEVTKSHADDSTFVKILTGSITLCAAQEDNEKKELADYGAFTIDRDTSSESIHCADYHYDNDPDAIGITEVSLDNLPRGKYTLKLDTSVLTSYKVMINDQEVTELTIDFEPTYDQETKIWTYPDVKFELRAKRTAPDLKDLT